MAHSSTFKPTLIPDAAALIGQRPDLAGVGLSSLAVETAAGI